jgi:hypothetical protein
VEDNLQIIFLREHSNIDKASKEIRKLLKEDLDHHNPGTTVVKDIVGVLREQPLLSNCYIKLTGLLGMKADIHRKFVASLLGAVQVGNGSGNEDLIYNERDYSIRISTRFNERFGDVYLGNWSLHEDDPSRYLKPPELSRLEDGGSPEEKDALRKRVIIESIATAFRTRAFVVNVVGVDGTVYHLGWDIATSLKAAYTEGKVVVRMLDDDSTETMITADGQIIPFVDIKIMYVGEDREEVDFIVRRSGRLFLTADLELLKKASGSLQGMVFKDSPWTGNPSDLRSLSRCVPSVAECLLRIC